MDLTWRVLVQAAASAAGAPARVSAPGQPPQPVVDGLAQLAAMPVTSSGLVVAGSDEVRWEAAHRAAEPLFVGSAIKTFILAQCLRAAEAGQLSEDDQHAIDDAVRSPSSPVFLNLTGTTTLRSVLEAMIAHSDNTATDVALALVGPDRVRDLVRQAGLGSTRVPDSTRRLVSYLAGAEPGTDLGWTQLHRLLAGGPAPGPLRAPVNDVQTMMSTTDELVRWYRRALLGGVFAQLGTLAEFKRISAMADSIAMAVPSGVIAYGKGGSLDWGDFHCFCLAGQMIVGASPVTFCFTINWTGPSELVPGFFKDYVSAVRVVLQAAAQAGTK
ncbi:serine hydrolase [Methylobacterium oxalidis]|uniref:serine hydrolase n=1 Tax=Methylobacterium oxalidis TaxID=944322 RepID=UPI003315476A